MLTNDQQKKRFIIPPVPIGGAFILGMVCLWLFQNVSVMDIGRYVPKKAVSNDASAQSECVSRDGAQTCACPKGMIQANGQVLHCLITNTFGTLLYSDERAYDGGVGLRLVDRDGLVMGVFGLGGGDPLVGMEEVRPLQFATKVSTIKKLSETSYLVLLTNPNFLEVEGLGGLNYQRFIRVSFSPPQLEPLTDRDVIGLASDGNANDYVFDTGTDRTNPVFVLSRLRLPDENQPVTSTLEIVSDLSRQLREVGFVSRALRLPSMSMSIRELNEQRTLLRLDHFYIGYGVFSEEYQVDISSSTKPIVTKLPNTPVE